MTRDIILEELMTLRFQFNDLKSLMLLTSDLANLFQEKNKKKITKKVEDIMVLATEETVNFQEKKVKFLSWIDQVSWLVLG